MVTNTRLLFALASSVLAGCSSIDSTVVLACGLEDYDSAAEETVAAPEPVLEAAPEAAPVALAAETSPGRSGVVGALRVNPDARLVPYLLDSAKEYEKRLGLKIEIAEDGIPLTVQLEVQHRGQVVDALAHYDKACSFSECNTGKGVWIVFSEALLNEKSWAMQQTMDHELGHVVSGWGRPLKVPQHLPSGNMMAYSTCENHVCAPWSSEDATLLCGGAPCEWMRLGSCQEAPATRSLERAVNYEKAGADDSDGSWMCR